jgi:hypothetical protein
MWLWKTHRPQLQLPPLAPCLVAVGGVAVAIIEKLVIIAPKTKRDNNGATPAATTPCTIPGAATSAPASAAAAAAATSSAL